MAIDKIRAEALFVRLAEESGAANPDVDAVWMARFEAFSEALRDKPKTHIAFLCTALLAKTLDPRVDIFSVKAGAGTSGAYSARNLCHDSIVPHAARLGIDIGATGREPLNNQPYFRIARLTVDVAVRPAVRPVIGLMLAMLGDFELIRNSDERERVLRTLLTVRRRYMPVYRTFVSEPGSFLLPGRLLRAIETLTESASEGGRRAQAVVAGLVDVFAGEERVKTNRVNAPDVLLPADVAIAGAPGHWSRAFEVRDKPVSASDLDAFTRKLEEKGVTDGAVVALAGIDEIGEAVARASARGVFLVVYDSWEALMNAVLFWGPLPAAEAAARTVERIRLRLIELEASPEAVEQWIGAFGPDQL